MTLECVPIVREVFIERSWQQQKAQLVRRANSNWVVLEPHQSGDVRFEGMSLKGKMVLEKGQPYSVGPVQRNI